MDSIIYGKNLDALRAVDEDVAAAVDGARGEPGGATFHTARSGDVTASFIEPGGAARQMHSSMYPRKEAERFAYSVAPGFGKWIVVLGPGLWYGVRALRARMFHNPMCVVEAAPAMLRAAMERVPMDDILATPGLRILTGSTENIISQLHNRPIRVDVPHNCITGPAASIHAETYVEIKKYLERISMEPAPLVDPENVVRRSAFGSINPAGFRILITANDRYSDAVADTLAPLGVVVKTMFDFPDSESLRAFNPDLVFAFTANIMNWPDSMLLLRGFKSRNVPIVVWNLEDPIYFFEQRNRDMIFELARLADAFFTQSGQFLDEYEREGAHAHYLPTGARPDMFGEPLPPEQESLDFSFFGFWTPWRERFFEKLTAALPGLAHRLVRPGLAPEDYRDMIRATRVNLTALTNCDITTGQHWALSDRAYEVPYAGGFLLQDQRKHLDDHFSPNEIATFTGTDDCAEKIRHYAANPDERIAIRDAARATIRARHLWAHRMESIIERLVQNGILSSVR